METGLLWPHNSLASGRWDSASLSLQLVSNLLIYLIWRHPDWHSRSITRLHHTSTRLHRYTHMADVKLLHKLLTTNLTHTETEKHLWRTKHIVTSSEIITHPNTATSTPVIVDLTKVSRTTLSLSQHKQPYTSSVHGKTLVCRWDRSFHHYYHTVSYNGSPLADPEGGAHLPLLLDTLPVNCAPSQVSLGLRYFFCIPYSKILKLPLYFTSFVVLLLWHPHN